eukprot:scaffold16.g95.t1
MRAAAALLAGVAIGALARRLPGRRRAICAAADATKGAIPTPLARKVKVALCQLAVSADKQANLNIARDAIRSAAAQGAELVVLPEMWNCPYSNDSFPTYAEDVDAGDSPSTSMLAAAAAAHRVVLVHLFDIDIPGKITFKESLTLTPGDGLTVVDTEVGLLGIGICYDIRFPEMAMLYAARGVQLIVYPGELCRGGRCVRYNVNEPSRADGPPATGPTLLADSDWQTLLADSLRQAHPAAPGPCTIVGCPRVVALPRLPWIACFACAGAFNMTTGPAHWQLLQQARAVDNQLFVATCSPARDLGAGYVAWGHSTAVGPFAEILGAADEKPGIVLCEMDFGQIEERRQNMPLRQQKRTDLYALLDLTR